ncbi:UNVERIFIED_CONTAM: Presequence protease 2, chloroplastic/mitochondrial [Sesamum angustifolium]|uniref:Presequence protease 2, chloroplastic/mitochondrial n=1 Tax=Sesamum angustifolium TaxID=2727405 RepID=A0AAW2QCT2_9LAMI
MERAVLLRSLSSSSSSSTLASSTRLFSRSVHRLARLPRRHRLVPNVHQRSLLRRHLGFISPVSRPSLQLSRHFCSLSVRAVATSPLQSSPEVLGADDDVAEKLGFEKVSDEFIEECKSRAVLYKHKKTGAEVMSVSNEDENKVFGIVFRTPPKDSTGIPHILEHSVLCGSRKYPLKEPFVELLKGSLHTFLNAFTYPDRTCYPVASTNTRSCPSIQDFYNLVDVYLDAVFFPKCVEDIKTFQQEGWHYELNDPSEDITYKGVVFNEMKGVYSQPDSILGRASQGKLLLLTELRLALCPDNTYGVDSGGDPQVIPKLTFEEFKEFHRKYYHPSNARIWFYGDDDPNERLRILSVPEICRTEYPIGNFMKKTLHPSVPCLSTPSVPIMVISQLCNLKLFCLHRIGTSLWDMNILDMFVQHNSGLQLRKLKLCWLSELFRNQVRICLKEYPAAVRMIFRMKNAYSMVLKPLYWLLSLKNLVGYIGWT